MVTNKLQMLLIKHLSKHGSVKLLLPDGLVLEVGINQLDSTGNLRNVENYAWVMASQHDRVAVLDSYNIGLRYLSDDDKLVLEDEIITSDGQKMKRLDVV